MNHLTVPLEWNVWDGTCYGILNPSFSYMVKDHQMCFMCTFEVKKENITSTM